MSDVTLQLDVVGADDGPWELDATRHLGTVMLEVVDPHGPGGGNPVVNVSGPEAAVMAWLLLEYVAGDNAVAEALELLRPAPDGAKIAG